jgi:CheY-like chemotaxis protein
METQTGTILLTDDDDAVRRFLSRSLRSAGYSVTEASDGREAMLALTDSPFDLLITDLSMPGQEGWETIRAARAANADLKILAISGFFTGEFLTMSKYMGADATLEKPISSTVLVETCSRLLANTASTGV